MALKHYRLYLGGTVQLDIADPRGVRFDKVSKDVTTITTLADGRKYSVRATVAELEKQTKENRNNER